MSGRWTIVHSHSDLSQLELVEWKGLSYLLLLIAYGSRIPELDQWYDVFRTSAISLGVEEIDQRGHKSIQISEYHQYDEGLTA